MKRIIYIRGKVAIMKCITLKADSQLDYTAVSNAFIDNYMPQANGEFVKIYLYLLRCMSDSAMDLSISIIADKFDQTEKDVIRALRYFSGKGLLSIEYGDDNELTSITFLPISSEFTVVARDGATARRDSASSVTIQTGVTQAGRPSKDSAPKRPEYTRAMLTEFAKNEDIAQLLYMTQKYLGKPLSNTEAGTIIFMYDSLHFTTDLIEYLVESCISKGHTSMRYIEKTALDWADAGIDTVDNAREYVGCHSRNIYAVMKAFGLNGRNPAEIERRYISKWFQEYGFSLEIVMEACNRTIQTIHSPSFEYADTILHTWKDNNVVHIRDIEALDSQFNAKKQSRGRQTAAKTNNYSQRTYDFEQLEKQLLTQ